ncbi:MAG: TIR domain-containing protein [Polynucleobacter sp.]
MAIKRVFVSFDYDNDARLKDLLVGQSKNTDSPFVLSDWSIKEHLTGDWKEKARARIRAVDLVCVLCGVNTDKAAGVAAELLIAQEEGVPYFLLWGYKEKTCVKPTSAKVVDKIYKWEWDTLKSLIGGGR